MIFWYIMWLYCGMMNTRMEFFPSVFFLFLTAFIPPPASSKSHRKNVFQMNTGKDVSPHDGLLTPVQLLIIKFYSSQTKAILPNPKYPGKCRIRTLWEKRLKELNIYACRLARWWAGLQGGGVIWYTNPYRDTWRGKMGNIYTQGQGLIKSK